MSFKQVRQLDPYVLALCPGGGGSGCGWWVVVVVDGGRDLAAQLYTAYVSTYVASYVGSP